MYRLGDYVYPTDLPRSVLCRVVEAEDVGQGSWTFQILEIEPLEGPWNAGTRLIRLDDTVRPAPARGLWRARVSTRSGARRYSTGPSRRRVMHGVAA